jgi:iron(III) transport system substrate-binding protein
MPNAISLINGAPNAENAKKLIDFLISRETEAKLAVSCAQMPLIKSVEVPENVPSLDNIKSLEIDYKITSEKLVTIQSWLKTWTEK